jgi:hypothetical protein
VLICEFVSIYSRARARACACVYACLCERMYGFVRFHRIAIPRVCVASGAVRAAALCATSHRSAATCGIYSSARVVAFGAIGLACARSAAGVTWTCRTASSPWAARGGHTSVVDAAGAIYVIGGYGGINYHDVWASTDGGVRPDSGGGVVGGY